ncbi:MAG: hypothetical protein JKY67_04505 [Pseudomonadales bacterium]|nr:hypothetical protein [Pseudomonadales bacterium]
MRVGIDFENTMVDYDGLFYQLALERKDVDFDPSISLTNPAPTKETLRDQLINNGLTHRWLELQKIVYGSRVLEAMPYTGLIRFLALCKEHSVECVLVCHHSPRVFKNANFNEMLLAWLSKYGVSKYLHGQSLTEKLYISSTQEDMAQLVSKLGCTHFVSNGMSLFGLEEFPAGVSRFLFDPKMRKGHSDLLHLSNTTLDKYPVTAVQSWGDLIQQLDGLWQQRWKTDKISVSY